MERFDLLLRDATNGATIKCERSKTDLFRSVAWLKRMNARGKNIYVRPSGEHGLVLLDSLGRENIAMMCSKGIAPAITIEITKNEFQAWVKLSDEAMPEKQRLLVVARLTSGFGGSANRDSHDGYWRLAGFVNYVGHQCETARREYVLAHSGRAEIDMYATAYVAHVMKVLSDMDSKQERNAKLPRVQDQTRQRTRGR